MRQPVDPELLIDGGDSPFDYCYHREQREILSRALSRLPERERQVISHLYQGAMTMKEIAHLMHVHESRVSQIHSTAMARLKASVDSLLRPPNAGILESCSRSMTAVAGG